MFVLPVTVCAIIKYVTELFANASEFESLILKMKVKNVEGLDETGRRTYFVNMPAYTKMGASRSSHLFPLHNRRFHYWRTDVWTYILTYKRTACNGATVKQCTLETTNRKDGVSNRQIVLPFALQLAPILLHQSDDDGSISVLVSAVRIFDWYPELRISVECRFCNENIVLLLSM